jgi:hypothetical protein
VIYAVLSAMKAFARFLKRLRRCFFPTKPPDLPPKENIGPGTVHRELKRLATTATDKHEREVNAFLACKILPSCF